MISEQPGSQQNEHRGIRDELRSNRIVAYSTLALVGCAGAVLFFVLPAYKPRWIATVATCAAATVVMIALQRAGKPRSGNIAYVAILFVLVTALSVVGGRTLVPAYWGFVPVVLMAGLLLGGNASVVWGFISVFTGLVIAFLETKGVVNVAPVAHTPYTRWIADSLYIGIAVTLLELSLAATRRALARAETELDERSKVENALRALTTRFQLAARAAQIAVWDYDVKMQRIIGDSRFGEIYGLPSRDDVALTYDEWLRGVHPEDRHKMSPVAPAEHVDFRIVRPDGDTRHLQATAASIRSAGGELTRMVGVNIDVTAEKHAELEKARLLNNLTERVKELTLLHETASLLQTERPPDQTLLEELVRIIPGAWQYPEVCSARIAVGELDVRSANWRESPWKQTAQIESGTMRGIIEVAYIEERPQAVEGPFLGEERALIDSLGEMFTTYLHHHDAANALERREAEFSVMFEAAAIGIALVGRDGVPITTNPAFEKMLGYTGAELTRLNFAQFTHPDDIEKDVALYHEMLDGKRESYQLEKRYRRKDGSDVWARLIVSAVRDPGGAPTYFVGMVEDIDARKKAEEERTRLEAQLRQSQKMEAMGLLAGGVAHDFNNLITIISGYSELMLARRAKLGDMGDMVAEIKEAGTRAGTLTRQLLAFSRRAVYEPVVLDPNTLIIEMERMLGRLIGEDIRLVTELASQIGHVKVDRGQLEQALVNLVVNARDAMPTGGTLTLSTGNVVVDDLYASQQPDSRVGRHVFISVADTGMGMSEETRARIFEPFFTTKTRDRGTGLGLAMVYGFVKQCDGHVTVNSSTGRGATFRLVLPHVDERLSSDRTTPQHVPLLMGKERLLLVEDDNAVRTLTRTILTDCGYDVLAIEHSQRAAALSDAELQNVSMLLTDVVMPDLSGRQLADLLLLRAPRLKVLYMSGYTDDAIMRHGVLESNVHFLQKPFTPHSLSVKVREVLDEPPTTH